MRAVGVVHVLVAGLGPGLALIEAVGVLHDELPGAHEPEAGPDLVPELGLDLVEIQGHLPVGVHLPAHQVGDHLFVGGAEAVVPFVAVHEAQQFLAVDPPAAGLLPEFGRLHRGHQDLLGPGPVHLLADDALHLGQHPRPRGR